MNRQDLINNVAAKADVSKKDAGNMIDAFTETVLEAVKNGEKVQLVGFGTFEAVEKAERTGRNPHTGETITIPASRVLKFKPGSGVKKL